MPMSKSVIVTAKLKELQGGEQFSLRAVPVVRSHRAAALSQALVDDILQFDRVDIVAYK
jgi:hypothetical protein